MGCRTPAQRLSPLVPLARDESWIYSLRTALVCTVTLLGLLLLVDSLHGALTPIRAALWSGLSVLLFVVLVPDRVTAGRGWLASRGLVRERRVRTDRLVRVRWRAGALNHVVLEDVHGTRIELHANLLADNPALWRLLEDGATASSEQAFLLSGRSDMGRLSRHTDSESAQLVFKVSGLE
ncbi:hypothetical protein OG206_05670 [Streptomyces sp. NBC_01341]|uniref:hypothetical protein n=1 Tax=Streptomyces sp. NBC_01341 TaxID=2903831 RepID=UPI002E13FBA4|nr:hypothetical protein OG206_05670 [Streptomyces sp. NBC_01341]